MIDLDWPFASPHSRFRFPGLRGNIKCNTDISNLRIVLILVENIKQRNGLGSHGRGRQSQPCEERTEDPDSESFWARLL